MVRGLVISLLRLVLGLAWVLAGVPVRVVLVLLLMVEASGDARVVCVLATQEEMVRADDREGTAASASAAFRAAAADLQEMMVRIQ